MKFKFLEEYLEETTSYTATTFSDWSPEDGYDEVLDITDDELYGNTSMISPSHINIDDSETIDVIHNGQVMKTDSWVHIQEWIRSSYQTLTGTYIFSMRGLEIHRITIATA